MRIGLKKIARKKMKMKWQILLAIMIVSVFAVTFSVFSIYTISRRTIQNNYVRLADDNLSAFQVIVDKELDNMVSMIRSYMLDDDVIETMSNLPAESGSHYYTSTDETKINHCVMELLTQSDMVEGVFLIDNYDRYYLSLQNGKNISSYLKYYREGIDKDSDWYQAAIRAAGREVFWNGDVLNPDNTDCFSIVKALHDKTRYQPQGVFVLMVKKKFLTQIGQQLPMENFVMLLDENDNYIASIGKESDMEEFLTGYQEQEDDGNETKSRFLYSDRSDSMTGWKYITGVEKDELYAENVYMHTYLFILLPLVAGVVIVVALMVSYRIYRPLDMLDCAVKEIHMGKEQIETEFDESEIGRIGQTLKQIFNENLFLEKKIMEAELSKKNAQFLLLQSQINPHYLYNTLDSIYILALKHNMTDIAQMTLALSDMFKLSLNNGKGYTLVQEEMNYIENYMKIMNYRFHDRFRIMWDIEGEMLECYVLKFIFQPFIENAMLHGLEPKVGKGSIVVSGRLSEDRMEFEICDDGVGFNPAKELPGGYGIQNVEERIRLIYGEEYGFSIDSAPGEGTTVSIRIPVRNLEFYQQREP